MEAFNNSMAFPFSYNFSNINCVNTSSACTSNISTSINTTMIMNPYNMDSRIWSKLPQNLINRVIAFLPPPAFFRSRAVCKRWYGLLFSNTFLQTYLQSSPSHRYFIFFKKTKTPNNKPYIYNDNLNSFMGGYMFDPYNMVWYRLSCALMSPGFSPSSSSGGLICWVSDDSGPKSIILHNPLVNTLTQLPSPTLRPRLFPSIGLRVTSSSVDVCVAGDDLISPFAVKNLSSETFHIDGGGFYSIWGTTCSLPRLCSLESGKMVHVHGRFYCMNYSPFSVLNYDVVTNTWGKLQAPMRRFLRSPSLVENNGKLILIAAVEKSKLNVPKSLRLWCLQNCGVNWVEIERMPQQLYAQFSEMELGLGLGFECVGHGEFLVIMIRGSNKAVLFDFEEKRWQWISPCPFVNGDDEIHGFAYDPRIATPVTTLLDQFTLPSFPLF